MKLPYTLDLNRRLDRWVRVNADGTITVRTGKVEIGQGIVSAMAHIAAEELDVDYSRIRMVTVDTAFSPDEGSTSGSRSIEEGGNSLRHVCAEVRDLFVQEACRSLGVTLERVSVEDGTIRVREGAASLSYWALAGDVDLARDISMQVQPKTASELGIVGKALPRLDIPQKLTGAAFIQDIELPGMLHGRIARPPSYRARLVAVDVESARTLPGVHAVVREGRFLGVVAAREEQSIKAMNRLARSARWEEHADLPDVDAMPAFLMSQPAEVECLSNRTGAGAAAREDAEFDLHASLSRPRFDRSILCDRVVAR